MAAVEERTAGAAGARTRALFERHGRMVLGLCRVLLRDPVEAEDAAQQTFVSAHRALLGGTHVRDDAAWLATIARNECRGRIVARMREPLALSYEELVEAAGAADPEEHALPSEEVRQALAELPERQRQAVVLRDVYGLRYREVGAALGVSRPAVESLLFRARRHLRVRLRPVAGALVLPVALRESLAQALPGFAAAGGSGATVAGAAGASGLIAKLGGAPLAAKVSAGALAVGAGAGSVTAVDDERADGGRPPAGPAVTVVERPVVSDSGRIEDAARRHGTVGDDGENRGRRGGGSDDSRGEDDDGSSGPGSGGEPEREGGGDDDSSGSESGRGSSRSGSPASSGSGGSGSSGSGGNGSSGSSGHGSVGSSGSGSNDGAARSGTSGSGSPDSSGSGSSGSGSPELEPESSSGSGSSGSGSSGSPGSGSED
jgi:RNA polymerase sigma factor (sigma-70 family)